MKKRLSRYKKLFKDNIAYVAVAVSAVLFLTAITIAAIGVIDKSYNLANIGNNIHSLIDDWFPTEDNSVPPGGVVDALDSTTKKNSQQTSQPSASSKPDEKTITLDPNEYKCTPESIPYTTSYEYDSSKPEGTRTTREVGMNGLKERCKDGVHILSEPLNAVVVIGTKPLSNTTTGPTYTYAEAYDLATSNCRALIQGVSSAYSQCVQAYLHKYGY